MPENNNEKYGKRKNNTVLTMIKYREDDGKENSRYVPTI